MNQQILYLEGEDFASPFLKMKEGETVRLTIKAVFSHGSEIDDYEMQDGSDEPKKTAKPYAVFVIADVNDVKGRRIASQSQGDIERQIAEATETVNDPLDVAQQEKDISEVYRQRNEDEDPDLHYIGRR